MDGARFYLQALSFDPSKKESAFEFKRVINSVEEARQLFKPVGEDAPPAAVQERQNVSVKQFRETKKRNNEEIQQLRGLVETNLNENEKLQSKASEIQKLLDLAKKAAQEFEFSLSCCICKSSKVSVAFMPCRHTCCCNQCWNNYLEKTTDNPPLCPLCRGPVQGWMNVHLPRLEKSIDLDSPCRFADQTLAGWAARFNKFNK